MTNTDSTTPALATSRFSRLLEALLPPFKLLRREYGDLLAQKAEVEVQREQLTLELEATRQTLVSEKWESSKILGRAKKLHGALTALKSTHEHLEQECQDQQFALENTTRSLEETRNRAEHEREQTRQALLGLKTQLEDLDDRYQLVTSALSAVTHKSAKLEAFARLFNDEYIPFANSVNVLANEAEMVIRLKAIEDRLRIIETLGKFRDKNLVAVSGGFSSGKSSFITSLFKDEDFTLPIEVDRATAIPTYVFHGDETRIVGYTNNGGYINIEPKIYARLTHQYVEDFQFRLRDLLPFAALEVPLKGMENIAFIDLPGYNPAELDDSGEKADEASALEFINQTSCVLWVIGLDSSGSVPRSDIDFMGNIPVGSDVYVVLNKADLRAASDAEAVAGEVAELLEDHFIEYRGISIYSSEEREEYAFTKLSLSDMLQEWNHPKDSYATLVNELDEVFTSYYVAFENDIASRNKRLAILKALELDLNELGVFNETVAEEGNFDSILAAFRPSYAAKGASRVLDTRIRDTEFRELKIECVMQSLTELREANSTGERENQLEQARAIHSALLCVLDE